MLKNNLKGGLYINVQSKIFLAAGAFSVSGASLS